MLKQIGYHCLSIFMAKMSIRPCLISIFHLSQLDQFAGERLNQLKQTYQAAFERYDQLRKDWLASQQEGVTSANGEFLGISVARIRSR